MRSASHGTLLSIAALCVAATGLIAGCGGEGEDYRVVNEAPAVSGMLRQVRSAAELEASLKSSLTEVVARGELTSTGVVTATTGATEFSSTYTVEAGVDEFDYARYDGTYLYVAPPPGSNTAVSRAIRVLWTEPTSGTATQVSAIPIESNQQVEGLFVADGRLVMVTSEVARLYPTYGEFWATVNWWKTIQFELDVFDVSDPAHPARLVHATLDGAFITTRRIGDRVYLVSRHSPFVRRDSSGNSLLAGMTLDELLPKVTIAGLARPLASPSSCYITNDEVTPGYPNLVTLTSFSMQNPAALTSTCYNGSADGVYASTSALYVSEPRSVTGGTTRVTHIHKFAFKGAAPAYAGSAEIRGELWMSGQREFRMSEHQGMLRAVTTEQTGDPADVLDHRLFILRPKADESALEVVSSLPNATHPEEIGKPGEDLFGVRFVGDRAYAITFRWTDPLYVFDLSNPADPRITGTLEIPGFSDFLHPVTQNLLLGLGRESGNIKIELFDVSVLEQPQSRGRIVFNGLNSNSEALSDRHAFTWLPAETADRFAIPATVTPIPQPGVATQAQSSLHQFEILGKQSAASASLQAAGVISPATNDSASSSRAFIHGDTVYYVRDGKVWSTSWYAPSQVRGPF